MPNDTSLPTDADALRAEVLRLREIVGPDEATYQHLRVELWAARDAAFGAEMAAGELGPTVVLKACGSGILHKSELGLVRVGVARSSSTLTAARRPFPSIKLNWPADARAVPAWRRPGRRRPSAADPVLDEGRRGAHGSPTAAQIWGVSTEEYENKADAWPLNPSGELPCERAIPITSAALRTASTLAGSPVRRRVSK